MQKNSHYSHNQLTPNAQIYILDSNFKDQLDQNKQLIDELPQIARRILSHFESGSGEDIRKIKGAKIPLYRYRTGEFRLFFTLFEKDRICFLDYVRRDEKTYQCRNLKRYHLLDDTVISDLLNKQQELFRSEPANHGNCEFDGSARSMFFRLNFDYLPTSEENRQVDTTAIRNRIIVSEEQGREIDRILQHLLSNKAEKTQSGRSDVYLKGNPGTGKTVLSVFAAFQYFANLCRMGKPATVILLLPTEDLAGYCRSLLREIFRSHEVPPPSLNKIIQDLEQIEPGINILRYDQFLSSLLGDRLLLEHSPVLQEFLSTLTPMQQKALESDELFNIRILWDFFLWSHNREVSRDKDILFRATQDRCFEKLIKHTFVLKRFEMFLEDRGYYSIPCFLNGCRKNSKIPPYSKCANHLSTLPNLLVVMDEIQDRWIHEIELFRSLFPSSAAILLAGDVGQRIRFTDFTWQQVKKSVNPFEIQLRKNYRTTREIACFLNAYMKKIQALCSEYNAWHTGKEFEFIESDFQSEGNPINIIIEERNVDTVNTILDNSTVVITNDNVLDETIVSSENFFNIDRLKGLDFDDVTLYRNYCHSGSPEEMNRCFTAMSRARKQLKIIDNEREIQNIVDLLGQEGLSDLISFAPDLNEKKKDYSFRTRLQMVINTLSRKVIAPTVVVNEIERLKTFGLVEEIEKDCQLRRSVANDLFAISIVPYLKIDLLEEDLFKALYAEGSRDYRKAIFWYRSTGMESAVKDLLESIDLTRKTSIDRLFWYAVSGDHKRIIEAKQELLGDGLPEEIIDRLRAFCGRVDVESAEHAVIAALGNIFSEYSEHFYRIRGQLSNFYSTKDRSGK